MSLPKNTLRQTEFIKCADQQIKNTPADNLQDVPRQQAHHHYKYNPDIAEKTSALGLRGHKMRVEAHTHQQPHRPESGHTAAQEQTGLQS